MGLLIKKNMILMTTFKTKHREISIDTIHTSPVYFSTSPLLF